jgi:adenylate kinase family enzyme
MTNQGILIVVEGPDGSGKTTLAEKLLKTFPQFEYQKPVPSKGPEGQTSQYMITWMNGRFKMVKSGTNYIMDRINLVSEEIYGPICRGYSMLCDDMRMVDALSNFFGTKPIIIYCRPDEETIFENLNKDQSFQMVGVRENITEIIQAYDRFFGVWESVGVDIQRYNYKLDLGAESIIEKIKEIIEQKQLERT